MWTDTRSDIKCPRGDCIHYAKRPDEPPCKSCTCNRESAAICREFRYETAIRKEQPPDEKRHP